MTEAPARRAPPSTLAAIVAIARRELLGYVRQPIAYVVGVLFLVVQGVSFAAVVNALSDPGRPAPLGAVLEGHFGGTFVHWAMQLAVLGALAMRTIADDRRTGLWEATLTAPVSEAAVVTGKWLAAATFYAALWVPTAAYLVVLAVFAPPGSHYDLGPVASAYLGEIVVGAGLLAVAIAASAATASVVVAAVASYAALLLVLIAGQLPALLPDAFAGHPTLAAALGAVDVRGQVVGFARGELALATLIVQVGFVAVGLSAATTLAGLGRRRRGELAARGLATALVAVIATLAAVLATRHPVRVDVSASRRNSLAPETQARLAALSEPVEIAIVRPAVADLGAVYDEVDRVVNRMVEAQPLLRRRELDPVREPERVATLARDAGLDDQGLRLGAVFLSRGPRRRALDLLDLGEVGRDQLAAPALRLGIEGALAGAIASLADDSPVTVCTTSGHGELPLGLIEAHGGAAGGGTGETWAAVADRLRRDGLRLVDVGDVTGGVPADCRVVLIIAPTAPLRGTEALAVDRYLADGGAVLVAASSRDRSVRGAAVPGLELVLARWGVSVPPAMVVDVDPAARLDLADAILVRDRYADHPITAGMKGKRFTVWERPWPVLAGGVAEGAPVVATPLVQTSERSWAETDLEHLDAAAADAADVLGPVALAAAVERPGGGRMVVLGSAAVASSAMIDRGLGHGDLLAASAVRWLAGRATGPVELAGPPPDQVRLVMTRGERYAVMVASVAAIPAVFVALGAGLGLWRRRRRQRALGPTKATP